MLLAISRVTASDLKVAIFDYEKVVKSYHLALKGEIDLKHEMEKAAEALRPKVETKRKQIDLLESLQKRMPGPGAPSKERTEMNAQINALKKEVLAVSNELSDANAELKKTMTEMVAASRKEVISTIRETAIQTATKEGFNLLLNDSINSDILMVLPSVGTDITASIIMELNKNAPTDFVVPVTPGPVQKVAVSEPTSPKLQK